MSLNLGQMQALLKPLLDAGHELEIQAYPRSNNPQSATQDWFYLNIANLYDLEADKLEQLQELGKRYGCRARVYVWEGKLKVQFS